MTASPTTDGESIEFSTRFQTATEFFNREEPAHDRAADEPAFAKSVVFYDQATPIFVCTEHHPDVQPLKHEGSETCADPDLVRGEAYTTLFEESPECDVCSNELPAKVSL